MARSCLLICSSRQYAAQCHVSSISQSQRSTLLSASLLHTDWLNPVRLLARGGGEEESGEGEGGECCCGVDEHENDNAERESRGEDRAYTPFLFDLRPSPAAGEGEERAGGTGDGLPPGCVTLSDFTPGARIMTERQRSPAELPRLREEVQD